MGDNHLDVRPPAGDNVSSRNALQVADVIGPGATTGQEVTVG
jgi:hypothetical protein